MSPAARWAVWTGALLGAAASIGCAAQGQGEGAVALVPGVTLPKVDCFGSAPLDFRVVGERTYFWCKGPGEGSFVIGSATKGGVVLSEMRYRLRGDRSGWDGTLRRLGDPRVTVDFVDGEPVRCATERAKWAADGKTDWQLDSELVYEEGLLRRRWTFRDGVLREEEELDSEGRRHGKHTQYWPSGALMVEEHLEHGTANGRMSVRREDGTWIREEERADGRRHGAVTIWDTKGQKRFTAMYDRGILHGEFTVWAANGQASDRGRLEHGEGPFVEVDDKGEVTRRGYRRGNDWEGPFTDYYASGKRLAEGRFLRGKMHGPVVAYWESGPPKLRGQYVAGTAYGVWEELHENGNVSLRGSLRNEGALVPHGVWQRFNLDGSLAGEDRYDHGKVTRPQQGGCSSHSFSVTADFRLMDTYSSYPCPELQIAQ